MSVWTHVAGTIRVDCLRGLEKKPKFKKIFVKDTYNGKDKGKCNMPSGSEGSLDYYIIENPDECSIAAYTVVIHGDLRDFGKNKEEELIEWWNKVLKKCKNIRQAVLQAWFEDDKDNPLILHTEEVYYDV